MDNWSFDRLAHRVISDPVFRQLFMADPEVAIREAEWDIPPRDMAALKEWHANMRYVTKLEEIERSLHKFIAAQTQHHRS